MKKLLGVAVAASAISVAMTGAASAEASFSGNVALTSDYVFRGVSQSDSDIAIQGGLDYSNGIFYAGTWGSSIDLGYDGTIELDVYGGVKPTLGPVTFDLGVIGYFYPGTDDDTFDANMVEFKAGASIAPAENIALGAAVYYSPDLTFTPGFDDATGVYVELNGAVTFSDMFAASAAVGNQSVDVDNYFGPGEDSYTTWNIGGTLSVYGFGVDLRYFDTDIDPAFVGPSGDETSDGRVVLTLKRAL
ncbi:MAG: hypothetical protein JNJ73_18740 [Hyphomonadaceae bacterium]|nr:hypothetical protein [Hyphomonadaceae bacterium]